MPVTICVPLGHITDVILLLAIILLITFMINISIIFISFSFPLICEDVCRLILLFCLTAAVQVYMVIHVHWN